MSLTSLPRNDYPPQVQREQSTHRFSHDTHTYTTAPVHNVRTSSMSCAFCSRPFFLVFVNETVLEQRSILKLITDLLRAQIIEHSPTRFRLDFGIFSYNSSRPRGHLVRMHPHSHFKIFTASLFQYRLGFMTSLVVAHTIMHSCG